MQRGEARCQQKHRATLEAGRHGCKEKNSFGNVVNVAQFWKCKQEKKNYTAESVCHSKTELHLVGH